MSQTTDACLCGNLESAQQNVEEVLQNYFDLFKNDCLLNNHESFASNCVIDWFGVSVRNINKIGEFLRYKLKPELQHADFSVVERCEPIEIKPMHMTTKSIPRPNDEKTIISRQQQLAAQATSLKTRADSDVEDNEATSMMNTSDNAMDIGLSSPENLMKNEESVEVAGDEESSNDAIDINCSNKRYKRKLPQLKSIKRKSLHLETERTEEVETNLNNYSNLHYLETKGRLLALDASNCDRNVRLRISYRKHLIDGTIQFALIIYERLQDNAEPARMPRKKLNFDNNEANDELANIVHEESNETALYRPITPINSTIITTGNEDVSLSDFPALRTPTRISSTPPATPRRRRRDISASYLERAYASGPTAASTDPDTPRKPPKKCNAARTLRL